MNNFDNIAKEALESLREEVDIIIDAMADGVAHDARVINDIMVSRLLFAREALALARYSESILSTINNQNKS